MKRERERRGEYRGNRVKEEKEDEIGSSDSLMGQRSRLRS